MTTLPLRGRTGLGGRKEGKNKKLGEMRKEPNSHTATDAECVSHLFRACCVNGCVNLPVSPSGRI